MLAARPLAIVALTSLVAIASGCGSTSDALQGKDASSILQLAAQRQASSSLRFRLSGALDVSTAKLRNLSDADLRSFGVPVGRAGLRGDGEQESSRRQATNVEVNGTKMVRAIAYDGTSFVSEDGGKSFREGSPSDATGGVSFTPPLVADLIKTLRNPKDVGRRVVDGQECEHIRAPVTRADLGALLNGGANAGGDAGSAQLVRQLVDIRSGSIDLDVRRSDGALVATTADADLALDLDRLGALFGPGDAAHGATTPGGTLLIKLHLDTHFRDYGAPVRITRPMVTTPPAGPAASPVPSP